ncbi:MAG: helix-turn-helix transcriptional regulator [Olegusella sp.]|nr:helix-turn-helix transcriptional regulator [Olegusella sp.]
MIPQKSVSDSLKAMGRAVAEARAERGLTQEQFAGRAGVSTHTLLDFEAGRGEGISYRNLAQILAAAGLEPSVSRRDEAIDYVGLYLAPWNATERNRMGLRVGDGPERARRRLERKRRAIYGK